MIVTREMGTILPDTTMSSPVYIDVRKEPFRLCGFCEPFRRVPVDVAEATSERVALLAGNSTGGRIRFRTNSDFIVMHGDYYFTENSTFMPAASTSGFDIYFTENGRQKYKGVFSGSQGPNKQYTESRLRFDDSMKEVTIYFPISTSFNSVYVGLREGCVLEAAGEYTYETPVVYYGSSIVHGIGAMRPSSAYPSIISRRLDTNYINLGFGSGAKGEKAIMEYIAGLDMSVLVYDYDHNTPSYEHLEQTHYAGYKLFREKQPDTPVIMASRVDYYHGDVAMNEKTRALIEANYERAKAEGDKNVYFVDGSKIYPDDMVLRDDCTSDNCHPNDMGYSLMATKFGEIIEKLLKK